MESRRALLRCSISLNSLENELFALADILTALSEELEKLHVPQATKIMWLEGLSEIEYRLRESKPSLD